jgi:murein tripeptide amidase MpaA
VAALVFTSWAGAADRSKLEMYVATVDQATARELVLEGFDVAAAKQVKGGVRVDLVLSASERDRLAAQGVELSLKRNKDGLTVQQQAAAQSAYGFNVWRSWDEPGGIRDELYEIAQKNPSLVKLVVIGHSGQGREIIALKVTKNARTTPDGARPDVFYMATIHAREWISTEVNRRLLHHFVDNYGKNAEVTNLVNTRELWFVPVANPDGYQYTFDVERLWRKNLRDNNGDGETAVGDGVDPNRNYD